MRVEGRDRDREGGWEIWSGRCRHCHNLAKLRCAEAGAAVGVQEVCEVCAVCGSWCGVACGV